ncbi:hypothetical protein TPAR_00194 [Tolypocladium paradoxum]|uniref:Uncharacterized protein n=1 Tax=Tolypocladium paradoxum TaxID=94208 RepID=A0A2S4LAZ4_9HYPO|nr:hypothetical protein TPAR_00194 [Tolypocladium paradoxum]
MAPAVSMELLRHPPQTTQPAHNVRGWHSQGRDAATSQITVSPIITAERAVHSLQLPRVRQATDEGCLSGEQGRAGPAQGPGAGAKGPQGAAGLEAANRHRPILPAGPVSCRGRHLGQGVWQGGTGG